MNNLLGYLRDTYRMYLLLLVCGGTAYAYGEHLEANAVSISEVPSHFICEHDTWGGHYLCYGEQL
jgi:hypothetical protein